MAISTRMVILVLVILIQGCFVFSEDHIEPEGDKVPEKIEHGEKGKSEYNVDTITLSGNQHTEVDNSDSEDVHPPWPPRPGRRSFIAHLRTKKSAPTIMRPGRELNTEKAKRKSSPQFILRPGRSFGSQDEPKHPNVLRPGRDEIDRPPTLFRPGREDVPQASYFRPGREIDRPPSLFRPGREDVPQASYFRPGREIDRPPSLFRPGREDVPQVSYFRPGREIDGPPSLFRPGREDVPQVTYFRPGREIVSQNSKVVRPGRRNIHYNMPWTYVGNTVDAHTQRKTHTFRQKAQKEDSRIH